MIIYFGDILLRTGSRQPLMKNHSGQDWVGSKIYIDNKPIDCFFDKRMGSNLYFEFNDVWYFVRMESQYCDANQYAFNPLTQRVKFKTKL